ncbi:helix-turn-helix transcriptional regulator [Chthonobacter albigriseus]|uniref:helix-turn-helix transcriptional regulator n=1 Tax=Chthonobacter albigriseus TaxID=1683161 RepID=UPI0015EE4714|nr:helix-turn-helix transcriptional regulator [Chthonobacter albigriseus]
MVTLSATGEVRTLNPVDSAKDLGMLVRRLRKAKGFSQQEFADLAGVGRRFVSELEAGKGTISLDKALQVSRALGITVMARSL